MALVTILTTEGYKQFEDEFPYDLHNVPYGKVVVKADGKYHVGNAVARPLVVKRSLKRKDKNLTEFWNYIDRKMLLLQQQPFITDRASVFSKHELVAIISIHDYGKDTFHGLGDEYMEPMYQPIWQERFYNTWLKLKQQHGV